jgi:hypothetical protein
MLSRFNPLSVASCFLFILSVFAFMCAHDSFLSHFFICVLAVFIYLWFVLISNSGCGLPLILVGYE